MLEISQPQGDFILHQGQQPAILIASGSGITAIYSLLQQALKQQLEQIHVIYPLLTSRAATDQPIDSDSPFSFSKQRCTIACRRMFVSASKSATVKQRFGGSWACLMKVSMMLDDTKALRL